MENAPPSVSFNRAGSSLSGFASARKVALGGATPLAPPKTPGLAPRGLGTPAAGAKTGGSRAALGDISNCKKRLAQTTQPGAVKSSAAFDEISAVATAATELGFAQLDDDLPSPEQAHPAEPAGPVALDRSGFNVEAAVAALCAQRSLALGGTPYEQRSRTNLASYQHPPVLAEVPPSPANVSLAALAARGSTSTLLLPRRIQDALPTRSVPPQAPDVEPDAELCDLDEATEELSIDLNRFELVPPTPVPPTPAAPGEAEDAASTNERAQEEEGTGGVPTAEMDIGSVAPLDLSSRLADLAIDE